MKRMSDTGRTMICHRISFGRRTESDDCSLGQYHTDHSLLNDFHVYSSCFILLRVYTVFGRGYSYLEAYGFFFFFVYKT